jgi:hypothetical protein
MNMRARSVACLLLFFLTGCFHFHKTQKQQFQYLAPPSTAPKPAIEHPELPAAEIVIPEQPLKTDNAAEVAHVPKPPAHHRRTPKPVQQAAVTPPPAPAEAPGVSAIGQLSTGEPGSDRRRETEDSLATTERSLNGLGRNLNDQEQKTAAQIREFLKQAREALNTNDVDGAYTLAAKAKVLLGEIIK